MARKVARGARVERLSRANQHFGEQPSNPRAEVRLLPGPCSPFAVDLSNTAIHGSPQDQEWPRTRNVAQSDCCIANERIWEGGASPALPTFAYGVGSANVPPKMSLLPNVPGQSEFGAGFAIGVDVLSDWLYASTAGQSAALRTST
jgi:hypothetical protein